MSHTEQISLKHLTHAVSNPNPECLLCIRIALGKHSSMVLIAHCIALHLLLFSFSKKELRLEALKLYWILSKLCKHVLFHTLFTTIRWVRDHTYLLKSVRLASFSMVNINPDLYSIVQINFCPAKDHQKIPSSILLKSHQ